MQALEDRVPIGEEVPGELRAALLVIAGRRVGLGRVDHALEEQLASVLCAPLPPASKGRLGRSAEGDHRLDARLEQERVEPAVSVHGDVRVIAVAIGALLPVDRVDEGVDHGVLGLESELREEALYALAGHTDQDATCDGLARTRILADDQDAGASVEPSTMEDRSPLDSEVSRPEDLRSRYLGAQRHPRLRAVAGIEGRGAVHRSEDYAPLRCEARLSPPIREW